MYACIGVCVGVCEYLHVSVCVCALFTYVEQGIIVDMSLCITQTLYNHNSSSLYNIIGCNNSFLANEGLTDISPHHRCRCVDTNADLLRQRRR